MLQLVLALHVLGNYSLILYYTFLSTDLWWGFNSRNVYMDYIVNSNQFQRDLFTIGEVCLQFFSFPNFIYRQFEPPLSRTAICKLSFHGRELRAALQERENKQIFININASWQCLQIKTSISDLSSYFFIVHSFRKEFVHFQWLSWGILFEFHVK